MAAEEHTTAEEHTAAARDQAPPSRHGADSPGRRDHEHAIRAMLDEFERALGARDADAFGAHFAEDATFINPMGDFAAGRVAVRQLIAAGLRHVVEEGQITFSIERIRALAPDLAFVDLVEDISSQRLPDGTTGPVRLHVEAVMARHDGAWRWLDGRPHPYLPRPVPRP